MKELVEVPDRTDLNEEVVQIEGEVYAYVSQDVMVTRGTYAVIQRLYIREKDQKLFEARFRYDDNGARIEPKKLVLLERVTPPIPPSKELSVKDIQREAFGKGVRMFHFINDKDLEELFNKVYDKQRD